ncbi:histidine kinase [Nocardia sp. CDC186]|uniref:histidine kinase n=1 Tax=Nocardia implantans TaxID=3108168 RepID=A0ABU6AZV2_9NOCA|nr:MULTISPECIES: histidine kinase [unclassified Nocardia]MEA3530843.1 histidine kinase [Nocardia sp. CDC192]MEB3513027.1 histidine kinase [Nocardia sp. CDC186]
MEGVRRWADVPERMRDALGAVIAFAGGAALYLAGLSTMTERGEHVSLWVRCGVLAALCLATSCRRRTPVAAMVAGLVPLAVDIRLGATVPVWIVYADLIYAAVLYAGRRASRITALAWSALSAVVVALTMALTGDLRAVAVALVAVFGFVATPIWWANSVRTHKEVAHAERTRAEALTLVAELDRRAAVADERTTMARDLHDVIAGHLSAIALHSEAALGVLARPDADPAVAGIVRAIRANSVSALEEMRTMIGLLRSDDGAPEVAAPRTLAQLPILVDAARAAGISVRVHEALDATTLPSAVDQAAYRIVQEALTNAMKHAPGQEVSIDVRTGEQMLTISVRNRTAPARPSRSVARAGRRGLVNMRERAAALGGSLRAGNDAGHWEVLATLPLGSAGPA